MRERILLEFQSFCTVRDFEYTCCKLHFIQIPSVALSVLFVMMTMHFAFWKLIKWIKKAFESCSYGIAGVPFLFLKAGFSFLKLFFRWQMTSNLFFIKKMPCTCLHLFWGCIFFISIFLLNSRQYSVWFGYITSNFFTVTFIYCSTTISFSVSIEETKYKANVCAGVELPIHSIKWKFITE